MLLYGLKPAIGLQLLQKGIQTYDYNFSAGKQQQAEGEVTVILTLWSLISKQMVDGCIHSCKKLEEGGG